MTKSIYEPLIQHYIVPNFNHGTLLNVVMNVSKYVFFDPLEDRSVMNRYDPNRPLPSIVYESKGLVKKRHHEEVDVSWKSLLVSLHL